MLDKEDATGTILQLAVGLYKEGTRQTKADMAISNRKGMS